MTATPDPAEITPPTDPARYARRPRFGVAFWAVTALVVVVFAAGVIGARVWPRLWTQPPAQPQAVVDEPAAATFADPDTPSRAASPATPAAPSAESAEVAALRARIEALESGQSRTVNAAAAALAAAGLAEAAQGSGPFEVELAALQRVLPTSSEVRVLQPYAETGAPSRAALAAEFDAAAAKASVAARDPGERAGFLARLAHALSAIIVIRRVDTVTGSTPDAVLARAQAALDEGDVEGAMKALRELPPKATEALAPWRTRAQQRITVDRQVAAIRAEALSELMAVQRAQP